MAGRGQIIKRGHDAYLVRIFLHRDAVGKKVFHNRTIRGRKKDAEAYCTKILRELDLGTFVQSSRRSLGEFLDAWLTTKVNVAPKTLADYRGHIERHIKPALGATRLAHVSLSQVQSFVNSLVAKELKPRTIKYVVDVLNMALSYAVRTGELARNPCDLVELPRQRGSVAHPLTLDEVKRLRDFAETDRFGALWIFLLQTGTRPGEALALNWDDVDLDAGVVRIRHTLTRVDGKAWQLGEPKTELSRRPLALGPTLCSVLRKHRAQQNEERLRAGAEYAQHGFVFAARNGEPLDHRVVVRRYFKPLLKRAGLPEIRLYDLRHTSATLDVILGTSIKVVSARLGHSNAKMTLNTYQHVLPDMQEAAALRLDSLLHASDDDSADVQVSVHA